MRKRVERTRCPVCRNSPLLKTICTGCGGAGEAIIVHHPNGYEVEVHPVKDEEMLRVMYPDAPTPVHSRTSVDDAWSRFAAMVNIPVANTVQRREMRKAFYAGIQWFMDELSTQLDPDSEPTADDLEYMQRIHSELLQFAENVSRGLA